MTLAELWHALGAWRGRRQARRGEQQRRSRDREVVLWGGPVEAGRVLAFSDAIFAIAITLLTISLVVPSGLHGDAFTAALQRLLPALGAWALSFLILGQLWLAHHRIFGIIARVDYVVLRRNCGWWWGGSGSAVGTTASGACAAPRRSSAGSPCRPGCS
jgi:hypothetical protein